MRSGIDEVDARADVESDDEEEDEEDKEEEEEREDGEDIEDNRRKTDGVGDRRTKDRTVDIMMASREAISRRAAIRCVQTLTKEGLGRTFRK